MPGIRCIVIELPKQHKEVVLPLLPFNKRDVARLSESAIVIELMVGRARIPAQPFCVQNYTLQLCAHANL